MSDHDHDHEHDDEAERRAPAEEEERLEREARRLIALSRIRQYGDPALRMKAREVERFDDDLPRLVERIRMREPEGWTALYDALGVYLDGAQEQDGRPILVM